MSIEMHASTWIKMPFPNWVSRVTSLREKKTNKKKMNQLREEIKKMHNVIVLLLQIFKLHFTCRSLTYHVRLAAGLLLPDEQFNRNVSSTLYFLARPYIIGR
ncbi:hypothetical protein PV328_009544 [Microctonus aethiopoides]|uniref:Uncharacterized protein n=1 Tax=Microctonus aethiopoides TaxID=144406 RepID=A0AA39C6U4_9HYME|nr:hypothetical protein PV328_009544 [Microctonus aethiopoides]